MDTSIAEETRLSKWEPFSTSQNACLHLGSATEWGQLEQGLCEGFLFPILLLQSTSDILGPLAVSGCISENSKHLEGENIIALLEL